MATIKEIKSEQRHREWTEQIQECQNSGQTVKEWCKGMGISPSTYYSRLRAVREEMLSRKPKLHEIVPVSVSTELTKYSESPAAKSSFSDKPKSTELAKEIAEHDKVRSGYLLAYIYSYINDYPHALSELQAIIDNAETPKKKSRAVCEMGRVYYRMGEKETAVKYLSEAYSLLAEREESEYEGFYMFG